MMRGNLIVRPQSGMSSSASNGVAPYGQPSGAFRAVPEVRYRLLLRRHGKAIAAIMAACLLASVLVICFIKPSYKAKTVVEVLPVNQEFLNNKDIDPNMSGSNLDTYLDTQTRLLKSESVADRVVAKLLGQQGNPNNPLGKDSGLLGKYGSRKPVTEADIRTTLSHLQVKAEGQSSLIGITVTGPTAQLAADTANAVASQHIAALQDARLDMATQTTEFLNGQLESLRAKLMQSEDQLQAYARKNGLVFTSSADQDSVSAEKLKQIQADLERAEADRADKQSQMELIDSSPAAALPKVLDDGSIKDAESKLSDLRRQFSSLNDLYTPNHYKVREAKEEIEGLEAQIKNQRSLVVTRIKNDYKAAMRREALEKQDYNQQLSLVTDQSAKQVGYNLLKRDADANRDLYQSMSQKVREANVLAALRASNIRIVDRAKPPKLPDQPNVPIDTSIGFLAGCMLSVLYVLFRERSDASIRTVGQTVNLLQSRELAIVPSLKQDIRTQIVSSSKDWKQTVARLFAPKATESAGDRSEEFFRSWRTTESVVAESFRSAVASIILWGREPDSVHKVLVVTSAQSGAGKTTSVLNLGLGLVESGRNVLLIDGDLRMPRLGEIFGLKGSPGVSNIADKKLQPPAASELIYHTTLDRLHVLASGSYLPNVTELLHSDSLKDLIEYVRPRYDFIIIDSPPAIPLTDSRLLAQNSDGVIVVVKAGATTVEQTATVHECFMQDGSEVLGTILNHWDARIEDPTYIDSYMKYTSFSHRKGSAVIGRQQKSARTAGPGTAQRFTTVPRPEGHKQD